MGADHSRQRVAPVPVSITVIHPHGSQPPVPGYVASNNYRLMYTLIKNKTDNVKSLLKAMGRYGPPDGTGITGVSATADETHLNPETQLVDGQVVYLSFR